MYFSDYNAGRIDYFRETVEEWKSSGKITDNEYYYLLACLLESVSKVANVAGVYGAYLKSWDPRAVKEINFIDVEGETAKNSPCVKSVLNENIIDVIDKVDCDVLYLDPALELGIVHLVAHGIVREQRIVRIVHNVVDTLHLGAHLLDRLAGGYQRCRRFHE